MSIVTSPEEQGRQLLEFFGDEKAALKHAEWAYREVVKQETKNFWMKVIKELKWRQSWTAPT